MNQKYIEAWAGYRVDIGEVFRISPVPKADVLLIARDVLSWDEPAVEALLTHELCHWLVDTGQVSKMGLRLNSGDRYHGGRLYRKTDPEYEAGTRHTKDFCSLLAAGARQLAHLDRGFKDRLEVIEAAMRYDVF
jgi:hypothetical protein